MSRIMLIDASHAEQTRVVVTDKNRVVDFDVESIGKKQTIGNIYLAKVTRVEPSLQAAFVEYGEGRQGFLPFSEIHPDYYQIPLEDRQQLIAEQQARFRAESAQRDAEEIAFIEKATTGDSLENGDDGMHHASELLCDDEEEQGSDSQNHAQGEQGGASFALEGNHLVSSEMTNENYRPKKYKIQEVIKKRQILLVQVVKSERGNKGASMTTYLSLAGRYCVLMPNTAHGGGISRKITQAKDRQYLKQIVGELDIPEGMGLIVRTAGANRSKTDIERDYEYLSRLWGRVRDLTLSSNAPALVYEEGSLVKRSIRDIYSKDVAKIYVQGNDAYQEACDFMKLLMPTHVQNVIHYRDVLPLFSKFQIEKQLEEFGENIVQLRSGGYLVINQTEALVAIDINSGRSTNEFSVEDTAVKTNLEAADEIARQLRMRDLAGLIVIDFIDMSDYRNIRQIERRMKEALKDDKARIQVARISTFGLMEMTRQRLRPAMQDTMSNVCPHCKGAGYVVSPETAAVRVMRRIFEEAIHHKPTVIVVKVEQGLANFILNKKRAMIWEFERQHGIEVTIEGVHHFSATECEIVSSGKGLAHISNEHSIQIEDAFERVVYDHEETHVHHEQDDSQESSAHSRNRRPKKRRPHSAVEQEAEITEKFDAAASKTGFLGLKRQRFDKNERQDRFANKRRFGRFHVSDVPEIYTTDTGIEVVIENPVSVQKPCIQKVLEVTPEISIPMETVVEAFQQALVQRIKTSEASEIPEIVAVTENAETIPFETTSDELLDSKGRDKRKNRISKRKTKTDKLPEISSRMLQQMIISHEQVVQPTENTLDAGTQTDVIPENILQELVQEVLHKTVDLSPVVLTGGVDTPETPIEPIAEETPKPARRGWWRNRFGI